MEKELKIALCQMKILYEEKETNLTKAQTYLMHAADMGADMVLFPEMSFTGFSMNVNITGERKQDSTTISKMKSLADRYKLAIGFGWVELADESLEKSNRLAKNHYTMIDEKGRILADYVKIHPFRYGGEHQVFEGGMSPVTFSYYGHVFGLSICYDLRFPELYQYLSKTADVLITAANWPAKRLSQWTSLLQARAIENQSYMLGVNCIGVQEDISYIGGTKAFAPDGELLSEEIKVLFADDSDLGSPANKDSDSAEKLICISITDMVPEYRKEFPVKCDRKENLYKTWYDMG